MQNRPGTFIVIEGTDGSGKATQFELLCARLRQAGYEVATFDFPQYSEPSSYFVKQYLNGEYGSAGEVGPYTASLFYALDRYEAAPAIKKALDEGKIVVSNRFTGSSMGHQGTKFRSPEERRGYFIWLDNLEFEMLQVPRPDISFVLRVPAEIAQAQVDKKQLRGYTDKKRDIHEADIEHLRKSVEVYDDLTQLFPKDFQRVDCVRSGTLLDIDTIQNMLWEKITPLLPPPPQIELANKDIPSAAASAETTGGAAAAVAAVPSVGTAVPEPTPTQDTPTQKPAGTMREVTGQHFVVQRASHLLAQRLEGSALAAHLDQSGPTADFTTKDKDGHYRYITPASFDAATAQTYHTYLDRIFDNYAGLAAGVEAYLRAQPPTGKDAEDESGRRRAQALRAASAVLPAAAQSDVAVLAFGRSLENLAIALLADELPEARAAGGRIVQEARAIAPGFLDHGQETVAYRQRTGQATARLAAEFLPDNHAAETRMVQLTDVTPRNELDILPDILYPHSSLPLSGLRQEVAGWPYNRKLAILDAAIGERTSVHHKPGGALAHIRYTWDLMADYNTFRSLQRHRLAGDPEWQELTPRYGYAVPQIIEDAGLADAFEQCFDLSLELYSLLQKAGFALEAQYATLLGHKMRWKATYTAGELLHLYEAGPLLDVSEGHLALITALHDKLAETHPVVAGAMRVAAANPVPTPQQPRA
ncbi:MAG TPA: FAD-dependent thymidylate synthase [Candidatus Saccharimonadales bacterium]|nr:FAD-dependent thymidylate synthase [Candidatus Saccharimonadales bacterium]